MPQKVAVLGGGAAGVVVADELARRGAIVELFERNSVLGGLHRSVAVDGDVFDIGAFFFNPDHALIASFPAIQPLLVPVRASPVSITPSGAFDFYPLSPRGYLKSHGPLRTAVAICDLAVSRLRYRRAASVPDFACHLLGRTVYENSGLQHYIERLYGARDSEIELEQVRPRIQLIEQFARGRRLVRQVVRGSGTKTSLQLARPREGFPFLYARIAECLRQLGVAVHTDVIVERVKRVAGGFEVTRNGSTSFYDHVVSTIPVPVVLRLLGEPCRARFEHMNLASFFYRGKMRSQANVLYNFTFEGLWKRITVFSRIYDAPEGEDFLTVEVTSADVSPKRIEALAQDFEEHAGRLSLFESAPRRIGYAVTERAYPMCRRGHMGDLDREKQKLRDLGVHIVGRQGDHAYFSSHNVALAARATAKAIPLRG